MALLEGIWFCEWVEPAEMYFPLGVFYYLSGTLPSLALCNRLPDWERATGITALFDWLGIVIPPPDSMPIVGYI